ncbi:MAG: RHS repeat-associated core domain-containing protein, partial [Candidatus Aminicenantes bacterium]|nr:RHS repeat-associated core domain-containing protein [Candidatus Aminicenantes bacterium]
SNKLRAKPGKTNIHRTRSAFTTYYIWSYDGRIMAEYDATGICTKEYIYMGNRLIAEYLPPTDQYYYHFQDQINSTRIVTDDDGNVVHSAAHGPYGDIQQEWVNTYSPKQKFSGKERESYSDLDYFGARYYDSHSYRFISVDPVMSNKQAIINPQLWNLYIYCNNSPISFFDPDGRLKRRKDGSLKFRPVKNTTRTYKTVHRGFKVKIGYLFADNGAAIKAFRNESGDKRFDTDCHGYTFADGEYWIDNPQVQKILIGDNYKEVTGQPKVGNIVIYYDKSGKIVHSLTVSKVYKEHNLIFVKGLGGDETEASEMTVQQGWREEGSTHKIFKKQKK